ncbi:MAG: CAP domain-containing protein [Streptococcus sp.]
MSDNGNEAAASALALYKRGREEDGLTVGESGSLQANLRALEIADAINSYRRNAGLPELELDPYSLPASQVQLEYFKKANWHMFKYLQTKTLLMASHLLVVDFGTMKAAYQEVAAQYGLPTDETQIDANDIYMKIGAEVFAKVGHYLQMVDNKATALSVAYDPSNAMSEAAFLHSPVTSAVSTNALAYQLRQGAGATTTRSDVKAKSDEVANLKLDKANQESQIIILQGKLEDARHTNSNVAVEMANVQKTIQNYKILLVSDHAVEKAKATLMYLEVGLKQPSNQKKQPFKKRKICWQLRVRN